jgi:hypothetical protein
LRKNADHLAPVDHDRGAMTVIGHMRGYGSDGDIAADGVSVLRRRFAHRNVLGVDILERLEEQ